MIGKFLNHKDTKVVFTKREKIKDTDISKIASDVLPDSSSIFTENDDGWRRMKMIERM